VPLDESFIGRSFGPFEAYQVGREKIREFANAIGDRSPVCHDLEAARAAGHPDVVAPPTFPVVFTMPKIEWVLREPGFGWRFEGTVHGEQKITFSRPIHAGDELVTTVWLHGLRTRAGTHMLTLRCECATPDGEPVCQTESMLISQAGS